MVFGKTIEFSDLIEFWLTFSEEFHLNFKISKFDDEDFYVREILERVGNNDSRNVRDRSRKLSIIYVDFTKKLDSYCEDFPLLNEKTHKAYDFANTFYNYLKENRLNEQNYNEFTKFVLESIDFFRGFFLDVLSSLAFPSYSGAKLALIELLDDSDHFDDLENVKKSFKYISNGLNINLDDLRNIWNSAIKQSSLEKRFVSVLEEVII